MKLAVIGSGIMGNGIAQSFAMSGHSVVLVDLSEEALQQAKVNMKNSLETLSKKQDGIEFNKVLNNIHFTTDKQKLKDAEVVVEAIIENVEAKKIIFQELDELCDAKTILASNTSSLSITEMASVTNRRDRVVGLHFFNPVPLMKLVEVTATEETSKETLAIAESLVENINKESIRVKDTPLFVVNRLLVPLICEAVYLVEEGTASPEDIDKAMKLGAHHPIGPLWLADMIGLDTMLHIQDALYTKTNDPKYRVPQLLKNMVEAGKLGRKSGKGFYEY
ncbi:3-hydroxyacyl-CoA dehydrogenase NAD-binding domain-containing protein [Alkalihalophilus pseudofirmus]|uniref:3-hydroxyacyl-CoA dehydrogenase family protein n=1 Tax=Alkalihalophilus pseudofirmus TaxID=79885 RepID=UPI00259B0391|nr:3-hydroxyacyl-CoA dehydrogenase NAD-binding domain-containing protein [Alkalihalophilus pseudofirmus]WEG15186.1 3-hydroxyacyl-CoA dehydrogenase NAD-binding domain-containing protein [Alkalihalophilus pseudofirmus]